MLPDVNSLLFIYIPTLPEKETLPNKFCIYILKCIIINEETLFLHMVTSLP